MQHVRVFFNRHLLGDFDRADVGNAANIVAPQINQHEVLGALFGIGQQIGG